MDVNKYNKLLLALAITGTLSACNNNDDDNNEDARRQATQNKLDSLIVQHGITGDPTQGRSFPSIEDPIAQLGMKLFFSKALGGDMDSACVTCHHPSLGGGDDLSLSIGTGAVDPDLLGPGRESSPSAVNFANGAPTVPRNAPTTFNIALWDQYLFHDGRVESEAKTPFTNGSDSGIRTPDRPLDVADVQAGANLSEAQARFPVTSDAEMRGFNFEVGNSNDHVRNHLAGRLGNYGMGAGELVSTTWFDEFEAAFGINASAPQFLVTYANIAEAIAAYENSQIFVDTPWKAYVEGDKEALSDEEKAGAVLFYTSIENGGAGCVSCHSGDFFTDEQFHVVAIPQIGEGKGNGEDGTDDFGRFRESKDPMDMYAFRTPTLLNIAETGPYGHSGAYDTLEEVVRHHLNPAQAIDNYDFDLGHLAQFQGHGEEHFPMAESNTRKALEQLMSLREMEMMDDKPVLMDADLSDDEVDALVAFLHTLTDACVIDRECIGKWIPDASDSDPDGLRLDAVDDSGNLL